MGIYVIQNNTNGRCELIDKKYGIVKIKPKGKYYLFPKNKKTYTEQEKDYIINNWNRFARFHVPLRIVHTDIELEKLEEMLEYNSLVEFYPVPPDMRVVDKNGNEIDWEKRWKFKFGKNIEESAELTESFTKEENSEKNEEKGSESSQGEGENEETQSHETAETTQPQETEEELMKKTKPELLNIAKNRGIEVDPNLSKREITGLILGAKNE
nr:MAG TPA: Rho termination factor, N-terminal domain [Caudoviricetes sp.]